MMIMTRQELSITNDYNDRNNNIYNRNIIIIPTMKMNKTRMMMMLITLLFYDTNNINHNNNNNNKIKKQRKENMKKKERKKRRKGKVNEKNIPFTSRGNAFLAKVDVMFTAMNSKFGK